MFHVKPERRPVSDLARATVRARVEIRSTPTGPGKLGGYAAVFDQTTDLGWLGSERLARSAFDDRLGDDVRALWNHDASALLGRSTSGTLRLSVDSTGLEYEVDLPDTTLGRDMRVLVERGDVDGASFGFVPGTWEWDDAQELRTHTAVSRLVDVSPVTFPAYAGASTQARSVTDLAARSRSQLIRARARIALGGQK
jgi:HK97 family phage prohead protease